MGDNPGRAVVTDLGLERRSGGRKLVHLTQCRKSHVVREGRADRVGPNSLTLVVHRLRCRDPVHAHSSVILRFNLLDCAIESHHHGPANQPCSRIRSLVIFSGASRYNGSRSIPGAPEATGRCAGVDGKGLPAAPASIAIASNTWSPPLELSERVS